MAKLWALKDGLSLVVSLGLPHIIIEMDALVEVSFMSNSYNTHPYMFPPVDDCRPLLLRVPNYQIQHVFRVANKYKDAFASLGRTQDQDFVVFFDTPVVAWEFIVFNNSAVTSFRLVFVAQSFLILSNLPKKILFSFN